jgi:uncharacterized protein YlaI
MDFGEAGCAECDATPEIDDSTVEADANGKVTGGSYAVTCEPSEGTAASATGQIKIRPAQKCAVSAPDIEVAGGTLKDELDYSDSGCSECDAAPEIDDSAVQTDADGRVTGGSYTVTCEPSEGEAASAIGQITVRPLEKCTVSAPEIRVCEDTLKSDLDFTGSECSECDAAPEIDDSTVQTDAGGVVKGGSYTVTCEPSEGEAASAIGQITVIKKCAVNAPEIKVAVGTLKENLDFSTAGCSGCDATPVIDDSGVVVNNRGRVIGGTYTVSCETAEGCQSAATGKITMVSPFTREAIAAGIVRSSDIAGP